MTARRFRPRDPPTGQVPAGLISRGTRARKRGRPSILPKPVKKVTVSSSGPPNITVCDNPDSSAAKIPSQPVSDDASAPAPSPSAPPLTISSPPARLTGQANPSSVDVSPVSASQEAMQTPPNNRHIGAASETTPSTVNQAQYEEWAQRFFAAPDIRITGDLSTHNPPSGVPIHTHDHTKPCRTPGVLVMSSSMRSGKLEMTHERGYVSHERPVADLIRFFDGLGHDYVLKRHAIASSASIEWLDGPGLNPNDIRARRLQIHTSSPLPQAAFGETSDSGPDNPIWRVTCECNGMCRAPSRHQSGPPAVVSVRDSLKQELFEYGKAHFLSKKQAASLPPTLRTPTPSANEIASSVSIRAKSATLSKGKARQIETSAAAGPGRTPVPDTPGPSDWFENNENREGRSDNSADDDDWPRSLDGEQGSNDDDDAIEDEELWWQDGGPGHAGNEDMDEDDFEPLSGSRAKSGCGALLSVLMTREQCARHVCTITMLNDEIHHPVADRSRLKVSPYLRRVLHELSTGFSMTEARLKLWFTRTVMTKDQHAQWVRAHCPHRIPSGKVYRVAMKTAGNVYQIHQNPLAAMEIIAEKHPDSVIAERGPKFLLNERPNRLKKKRKSRTTDGEQRMECVIAPRLARVMAILQVFRMGMYMDSSYRNKNAFRCPLTMLVTLNEQHHMIPLAAMVSAHSDQIAYQYLLEEFERGCRDVAEQVLSGEYVPSIPGVTDADLKAQCKVFLADGLCPRFMMIDASEAERNAIQEALPGTEIRVCQFHMMQACRSQLRKFLSDYTTRTRDLKIQELLDAIRLAQRCPAQEEWNSYHATLGETVRACTSDAVWERLDAYLQSTWFSQNWASCSIDYGMPPGVTRDGPWSTNNYSEACFRTFDRVFLSCRVNRRLDRLMIILIDAYFPFYEDLSPTAPRPDPKLQQQLFYGLHRWETDCIRPCAIEKVDARNQRLFGTDIFAVFPQRRHTAASSVCHCGRSPQGREVCTCPYFKSTGKRCLHLWAMVSYELLGPVLEFEENMAVIEAHLKDLKIGDVIDHSTGNQEDDRKDFAEYWGKNIENAEDLSDPDPRFFPASRQVAEDVTYESSDEDGDQDEVALIGGDRPSPIMRRHQPIRSPPVKSKVPDVFDVDSNTHAKPGKPALIRALNPSRAKGPVKAKAPQMVSTGTAKTNVDAPIIGNTPNLPQNATNSSTGVSGQLAVTAAHAIIPRAIPSVLRLPEEVRLHVDSFLKPIGIKNTGTDCYITALIQVLAHLDTWQSVFNSVRDEYGLAGGAPPWGGVESPPNPVYRILDEVQKSLLGDSALAFPTLRTVLHEAGLIDSSSSMGDTSELYSKLLTYLDNSLGYMELEQRVFEYNLRCGFVHHRQHEADGVQRFENHHQAAILVYPQLNPTASLLAMAEEAISSDCIVPYHCSHTPPHTPTVLRNAVSYCHLFTIQVVWPVRVVKDADGSSRTLLHIERTFAIPERIQYGTDQRPWRLKGVICRIGEDPSSGHYIAIVLHQEVYWVMDDQRVQRARGVGREAFKAGRYPVLVFYERGDQGYIPVGSSHSLWSSPLIIQIPEAMPATQNAPVTDPFGLEQEWMNDLWATVDSSQDAPQILDATVPSGVADEASHSSQPPTQPPGDQPDTETSPFLSTEVDIALQGLGPTAGSAVASSGVDAVWQSQKTPKVTFVVPDGIQKHPSSSRATSRMLVPTPPLLAYHPLATPQPGDPSSVSNGVASQFDVSGFSIISPFPTPSPTRQSPLDRPYQYSFGVAFKHGQGHPHGGPRLSVSAPRLSSDSMGNSFLSPSTTQSRVSGDQARQAVIRYRTQIVWEVPESRPRGSLIVRMIEDGAKVAALSESPMAMRRKLLDSAQIELRRAMFDRQDVFSRGLHCGLDHTSVTSDDLELFRDHSSWWSNSLIDALCLTAARRLDRLDRTATVAAPNDADRPLRSPSTSIGNDIEVQYVRDLLEWIQTDEDGIKPRLQPLESDPSLYTSLPWPALGPDMS